MKRKVLFFLGAAILVGGIVFNVNLVQNDDSKMDLALINAEVLASGESGSSHSLTCEGTFGICKGECGVHQVSITKTGNDNTTTFSCSSN